MSQESTHQMLCQVEWANRHLEELRLDKHYAIIYNGAWQQALLLKPNGDVVLAVDGEPGFALWLLVARLEDGLRRLFCSRSRE